VSASRRVLLVEDHLDTVHTTARLLREHGHVVDYAINGYAAMEMARHFRPDVIFLDLGLPGMDGFDLCGRLRRDSRLAGVRIFAVTGYAQEEDRKRALAVGCDGHFAKPVDIAVLEKLLKD
jgi:CheY-like chemotaxis protein